jgi:hypothetical protein
MAIPKRASPYTKSMRRIFDYAQPFAPWIEEALTMEQDDSLVAGVRHYQWHIKQARSLKEQIETLMSTCRRHITDADESIRDLEYANAYQCITIATNWVKKSPADKEAHTAYDQIMYEDDSSYNYGINNGTFLAHLPRAERLEATASTSSTTSTDTGPRCHNCGTRGHIRRTCPYRRKPRFSKKKTKKTDRYY